MGDTIEDCETCMHPLAPHKVFALGEDATAGGIIICNVPGCTCQATWSLRGIPAPKFPDEETMNRLRAFAQGPHHWNEP